MDDCEFHETCNKCGNPEVKGLKDFPKGTDNKKPTPEQFLGYIEKRCPQCIQESNHGICNDKKCSNYVSPITIVYSVKNLQDLLNIRIKENPNELLRNYIKTIIMYADAIHRDGINCGENYQQMSNDIANNKLQ